MALPRSDIGKINLITQKLNNMYYEVKARFEKTMEDGMVRKVKEPYLFDALSFSEAEARARAEAAPKRGKPGWYKVSNGPVPVARPADFIQLTPIVQPIPLVPYSTQLQPLAMYDDSDPEGYDEEY